MFKKSVASKEQVKLMIALAGPSGSGKTYSALQIAYGITNDWSKITVADTENRSALYYAGQRTGKWEHIDFSPNIDQGYNPANWIKLIEFVESDPKTEVLILDSISHEWEAKGGALEMNQKLGGRFTDWGKVTPIHNTFVDKMRTSSLHIIATMRVKVDYVVEQNEKGRSAPKKVGLKSVQREGMDYEFGVMFDLDVERHHAIASKDRTGLFYGKMPFLITPEIGKKLLIWANEGDITAFSPKKVEIFTKEHAEKMLNNTMVKAMDEAKRKTFFSLMEGRAATKQSVAAVIEEMNNTNAVEIPF